MPEKNHVQLVAEELEKLGFTPEEADHLAREKHRAHADQVKTAQRDPGEIAEEIMERETAVVAGTGPEGSADGAEEIADIASANSAALDPLTTFEESIPKDR